MLDLTTQKKLFLASKSPYRAQLLNRLHIDFTQISSEIDESATSSETPCELSSRLACQKAEAVQQHLRDQSETDFIVIGSDQVATHCGKTLGKPGSLKKAFAQLSSFSNEKVDFYTAVCVIYDTKIYEHTDLTSVYFKPLSASMINNYIEKEDVLNCAGSFKSEGLGICLFDKIESQDPTALIGLPMIWLANCLQELGIAIL